ncbi:MAG: hypothetical protein C0506_15970 [Anaerolinea sp.]|nr:hypothetical protein [Anaerolinea sp.]
MTGQPSPIDAYLDQLLAALRCEPGRIRRILAETEDHLREAARVRLEAGADQSSAEREAVAAFGTPAVVAARFGTARTQSAGELLRGVGFELALLTTVALLAAGLSGVILFAAGELKGAHVAVRDGSFTVNMNGTRCFYQSSPGEPIPAGAFAGCTPEYQQQLAVDARSDELRQDVLFRALAGALGTVFAAGLFLLRRKIALATMSPVTPALGAVGFTGLALVLVFAAYDADIKNNAGAGMWLSGGLAALAGAAVCAAWLARAVKVSTRVPVGALALPQ